MAGKMTSWSQLPDSGLIIITGFRGEGKSALAWYLADLAHNNKRNIGAFDFTKAARTALPRWVKHVDDVRGVSDLKPSVLIVDEGALKIHARAHQSSDNIEWTRMLAIARHKGHLVILITQHQRQIDVGMVADADMVLMKRPSELHLRFARAELRPELEEAFQGFATRRQPQKWCYAVDYHLGRRGWLSNPLPPWWSERISKSFAAVDLEAADAEAGQRHADSAAGRKRGAGSANGRVRA